MNDKKPVDRAHEFTAAEIESVVRQLSLATEIFGDFLTCLKATKSQRLAAHNQRTLNRALANLNSSCAAMQKAIWLYRAGTPLEPGQLKPRSPAHAKPKVAKHGRKPKTDG
jgi:hypothetical protein